MDERTADSLGDRMKRYEETYTVHMTRRMPMIVRVDGKAFHSLTHTWQKPWDDRMYQGMTAVALALMVEQGAKIAYCQSDECSVLFTDYDQLNTEAWFDKNVQKIASVSASIATVAFNSIQLALTGDNSVALFDARAFVLPAADVCNYFLWRQRDAVRNSVQGLAQAHFSAKSLHGLNNDQLQEKLFQEKGINWSQYATRLKQGWCVCRSITVIGADTEIPNFAFDRSYIERHLPEYAPTKLYGEGDAVSQSIVVPPGEMEDLLANRDLGSKAWVRILNRMEEAVQENFRHDAIREMAIEAHARDGVLEIDENAPVSEGDDNGAYVMSWTWVNFFGTTYDKWTDITEKEDVEPCL